MFSRLKVFVPTEVVKYLIAGGLAFGADILLLNLLTQEFGLHYLISNTLGYSVGLLITYILNVHWVFADRKYSASLELPLFLAIVGMGYLISQCLMWLMVSGAALDLNFAKVVSTIFVTAFNFTAKKILLFTKPAVSQKVIDGD